MVYILALSGRFASSSPKGGASGGTGSIVWIAKASHFGTDSPRSGEKYHQR